MDYGLWIMYYILYNIYIIKNDYYKKYDLLFTLITSIIFIS